MGPRQAQNPSNDLLDGRSRSSFSEATKHIGKRTVPTFAELLHHRARVAWGYERPNEFNCEQLIKENYRGIRPAPGYPAQPDHTEKTILFDLLDASAQTGVTLTDQIEDYAARKGMTVREVEKWLAPWLGY